MCAEIDSIIDFIQSVHIVIFVYLVCIAIWPCVLSRVQPFLFHRCSISNNVWNFTIAWELDPCYSFIAVVTVVVVIVIVSRRVSSTKLLFDKLDRYTLHAHIQHMNSKLLKLQFSTFSDTCKLAHTPQSRPPAKTHLALAGSSLICCIQVRRILWYVFFILLSVSLEIDVHDIVHNNGNCFPIYKFKLSKMHKRMW